MNLADLPAALYVIGHMRHSGKRNKLIEVDIDNLIVNCVVVCTKLNPILFTALSLKESSCDVVGRED